MRKQKQYYTFKFLINYGIGEFSIKEFEIILQKDSLFDCIKNLGEFYFRLKIIKCYNITGGKNKEIIELRGLKTHDFNGDRYNIIKQMIYNLRESKRI